MVAVMTDALTDANSASTAPCTQVSVHKCALGLKKKSAKMRSLTHVKLMKVWERDLGLSY